MWNEPEKRPLLTGIEHDGESETPITDDICQICDGTGDRNGHLCKDCGGTGKTGGD